MARTASVRVACIVGLQVGCGVRGDPAAERAAQIAAGLEAYDLRCATCHEVEGAVGPSLSARSLAGYETAARLFNYVGLTMPYGAGGSLTEDQYWSVVAYLAASRELATWRGRIEDSPETRLTP